MPSVHSALFSATSEPQILQSSKKKTIPKQPEKAKQHHLVGGFNPPNQAPLKGDILY